MINILSMIFFRRPLHTFASRFIQLRFGACLLFLARVCSTYTRHHCNAFIVSQACRGLRLLTVWIPVRPRQVLLSRRCFCRLPQLRLFSVPLSPSAGMRHLKRPLIRRQYAVYRHRLVWSGFARSAYKGMTSRRLIPYFVQGPCLKKRESGIGAWAAFGSFLGAQSRQFVR